MRLGRILAAPTASRHLGGVHYGQWASTALAFGAAGVHDTGVPSGKAILTRIVLGAVLTAGVAGLLFLDWRLVMPLSDKKGFVITGLLILLGTIGFLEIAKLARAAGPGVLTGSGLAGALLVGTMPFWLQFLPSLYLDDLWAVVGLIVAAVFLEQMVRFRIEGAISRIGVTLLAVLYLGTGSAIILTIRLSPELGVPALVLFLAAVKCTDVGAYFTGVLLGRHKLIRWLSPGKTWEGLIGGLAFGAAAAVLVVWLLEIEMGLGAAVVFGAAVGLAGQFADLCESLLKRSAGVKDSSGLLPAFGGVLDVLDSPLLAAPVAYVLLSLMV